jgi:homoserine acetyltransferase
LPPSIFVYSNKTFYNGSTTAQELKLTPEYYHVKDFKLKSGAVIEYLKIEYAILATPKKDGQGNIINAVVSATASVHAGHRAPQSPYIKHLAGEV